MTHHYLKTWPQYFAEVRAGNKPFEVRCNDRNFQVGDTATLREYDLDAESYTGEEEEVEITYVFDPSALLGPAPGAPIVHPGWCVFGIRRLGSQVDTPELPEAVAGVRELTEAQEAKGARFLMISTETAKVLLAGLDKAKPVTGDDGVEGVPV